MDKPNVFNYEDFLRLHEENKKLTEELRNCRNELCLHCGSYREKHLGACDGCRYKEEPYGDQS